MILLRQIYRFRYSCRTTIMIDEKTPCPHVVQLLTDSYPMGYRVIAVPQDETDIGRNDLSAANLPEAEDAFIVPGTPKSEQLALRLLKEGKSVHIIPELLDARLFRQALGDIAGIPMISLLSGNLTAVQTTAKRIADLFGSFVLLVVLAPLFAVIACLIRMRSPGPDLLDQKRMD